MIKRKLIAAKDFVVEYKLEILVGAIAVTAITAGAYADLEEAEEKTKEVIETATHTIVLIEK